MNLLECIADEALRKKLQHERMKNALNSCFNKAGHPPIFLLGTVANQKYIT